MSDFAIVGFAHPERLLLALPVLAWLFWRSRQRPPALPWPPLQEARAAGALRQDPIRGLGWLLRTVTCLALVVAVAEPIASEHTLRLHHEGLDLVLVVDASGSMRALDAESQSGWRTRLDLAREVVERFARHRVAEGDRVALVVFGDRAFTQCPLTRDGKLLAAAIARVEAGAAGEATALGDALALAVKRVGGARPEAPHGGGRPAAGRAIVLLTDGRSNAGAVPVEVATALARQQGIRVHTVGIGSEGAVAMADTRSGGRRRALERHDLDTATLEQIASATGGRAFLARRSADLDAVYQEIDHLERVERREPPAVLGAPQPEPALAAAGLGLLLEILLTRVAARRLP